MESLVVQPRLFGAAHFHGKVFKMMASQHKQFCNIGAVGKKNINCFVRATGSLSVDEPPQMQLIACPAKPLPDRESLHASSCPNDGTTSQLGRVCAQTYPTYKRRFFHPSTRASPRSSCASCASTDRPPQAIGTLGAFRPAWRRRGGRPEGRHVQDLERDLLRGWRGTLWHRVAAGARRAFGTAARHRLLRCRRAKPARSTHG